MSDFQWRGDEVSKKMKQAQVQGLLMTASDCVAESKKLAPRDMNTLAQSIKLRTPQTDRNGTYVEWGSFDTKYALWVELGTKPHFPPVDALRGWTRRHLGDEDLAFVVARAIARKGTDAQPYLRPSADKHYPKLADNIRKAFG
jgi:hypothetical protein